MPVTPGTAERQQPVEAEAEGCTVVMSVGGPCGRPLYAAVVGMEECVVCLMHSRDPDKDDNAFQEEFERILKAAGAGEADFTGFVFTRANYVGREFTARCIFYKAKFTDEANFNLAMFSQEADFRWAQFTQKAIFLETKFAQRANFLGAEFTHEASFDLAMFTQEAKFPVVRFTQRVEFDGATFTQEADFRRATFGADAWFRETKFRNDGQGIGPIFSLARFEKPERVEFYQTYLGQALFHNCDVSKVVFSNVEWRKRKNGQRMIFEEVVSLKDGAAEALSPEEGSGDERNYSLIAELYQQLKKNFDDRRDYWTAGDFHWGEMEMKRLSGRPHNRVLRWLKQTLGLTALYKYASEYGESYRRPAELLSLILLLFVTLYPCAGFQTEGGEISYDSFTEFAAQRNWPWWSGLAFLGHSLFTAVSVMALQRDVIQALSYPLGRSLALLELLITSILIALFLLAVRRQFRR